MNLSITFHTSCESGLGKAKIVFVMWGYHEEMFRDKEITENTADYNSYRHVNVLSNLGQSQEGGLEKKQIQTSLNS